jgi:hypothetical protein
MLPCNRVSTARMILKYEQQQQKRKVIHLMPTYLLVFCTFTTSSRWASSGYLVTVPSGSTTSQHSAVYLHTQYWLNMHTKVSKTILAWKIQPAQFVTCDTAQYHIVNYMVWSQWDLPALEFQIRRVLTNFRILYTNINVKRSDILTEKEVKVYLIITTLPLLTCSGGSSSRNNCAVMVWGNRSGNCDY